jgi:hypothetical protein
MIIPSLEEIKQNLHFHVRNGTVAPWGGWFYYYYVKGKKRRTRFGTGKSKKDEASKDRAAKEVQLWLRTGGTGIAVAETSESFRGMSDYRVKKRIRDNIRACNYAIPTPFEHWVSQMESGNISDNTFPMILVRSEHRCYIVDMMGLLGDDGDTLDNLLILMEDQPKLWRLVEENTPVKHQWWALNNLCHMAGVELPNESNDFPKLWQKIEDYWHGYVERTKRQYDEWYEQGLIESINVQ